MPRSLSSRWILALVLLALAVQRVRAEPLFWEYSTLIFPGFLTPDSTTGGSGSPPPPWMPTPGVSLYGATGIYSQSATIALANWYADVLTNPGEIATYDHQPFQIAIGILDRPSKKSSLVVFDAFLDGTLSTSGPNLSISYPESTRTLQLGGTTYQIHLGSMIVQGPLGGDLFASSGPILPATGGIIEASVDVRRLPEPATLVLLGLGGSLTGVLVLRRRRHGLLDNRNGEAAPGREMSPGRSLAPQGSDRERTD